MYPKLKHRLVTLYTISTSIIFIIAILSLYYFNISNIKNRFKSQFQSLVSTTSYMLEHDNVVNVSYLKTIEMKSECMFYIEDSGSSVGYKGSYTPKSKRYDLFHSLRMHVVLDGMFLTEKPIYANTNQSKLYTIHGNKKDTYWGRVLIIPKSGYYMTLMILYSTDSLHYSYMKNGILFLSIALVGFFSLYLISKLYIETTLRPVDENNKKQAEFIACASHELRSPLSYIRAANSTLAGNCLPYIDHEHQEYLRSFIKNTAEECSRMSLLIEDMLLLASADNKTWTIHKSPVDADLFFIETFEKLQPVCASQNHSIQIELPDDPLGILILDEHRLFQTIQSLINNALHYTPQQTSIILSVHMTRKQLIIQIIDHGYGIPDSEKAKIFDRYYRFDTARTDRNHFGLGLNIAKELATLQNGKITLTDTPSGGCTFTITLKINRDE
jgi:two-component system, OmpR family, manganese sensing sensor histidine kinase